MPCNRDIYERDSSHALARVLRVSGEGASALARTIFHFYTGGSLPGAIMFKTIGLIIVLAVAAVLLLASTKPSTFRVERSTTIAAPPEKIAALIDDFHQWSAWS